MINNTFWQDNSKGELHVPPTFYFCSSDGKMLGFVQKHNSDLHKAVYENKVLGYYISLDFAQSAIVRAHTDKS